MKTSRTIAAAILVGTAITGITWYAMAEEPVGDGAVRITKVSYEQDRHVHAKERIDASQNIKSQELRSQ